MSKEFEKWWQQECLPDSLPAKELIADAFTAGRALGRREVKEEVITIMHDADMAHIEYEDSWYQAKDAIEAIPEVAE